MIQIQELLYHGTTTEYFERQRERHGSYKHDSRPLYLTDTKVNAFQYARSVAIQYSSHPLLLIVSARAVEIFHDEEGFPRAQELPTGKYLSVDLAFAKSSDVNPVSEVLSHISTVEMVLRQIT